VYSNDWIINIFLYLVCQYKGYIPPRVNTAPENFSKIGVWKNYNIRPINSKGIYRNQNNFEPMNQTYRYYILIFVIMAIVLSSGCIVPTKDKPAPSGTQSGGTNYLVPGTGSDTQQQTESNAQNQGTTTSTPIPDDTRYLTQVPTYASESDTGPTYRNLSYLAEPTPVMTAYQEIYHNELSLKDYSVAYAYELKNPPLTINFDIKPRIDSRTIWYESKTGSYDSNGNRADVFVTLPQISPDAWFEVKVRDKATGNIVLDDGFGKTFGGGTQRTVSVRSYGNYQIDMSGDQVNVTVRMYIINGTA